MLWPESADMPWDTAGCVIADTRCCDKQRASQAFEVQREMIIGIDHYEILSGHLQTLALKRVRIMCETGFGMQQHFHATSNIQNGRFSKRDGFSGLVWAPNLVNAVTEEQDFSGHFKRRKPRCLSAADCKFEFGSDDHRGPGNLAQAFEQVTFNIIAVARRHGTVQLKRNGSWLLF